MSTENDRPDLADSTPLATDPVCGMQVRQDTALRTEHDGQEYFFCSASCKERFLADPQGFEVGAVDRSSAAPDLAAPVSASEWTCPMHPEVRQAGPGACPICGMALEPVTISADSGPSRELADMTRRFWAAVVLSLPITCLLYTSPSPRD